MCACELFGVLVAEGGRECKQGHKVRGRCSLQKANSKSAANLERCDTDAIYTSSLLCVIRDSSFVSWLYSVVQQ